jgi:hypothetical protein
MERQKTILYAAQHKSCLVEACVSVPHLNNSLGLVYCDLRLPNIRLRSLP